MTGKRLAVALLVVLAGCGAVVDGPEPSPERTLTPAPVPEQTPTAPGPLPPGVTGDSVVDRGRLASAHASILGEQSFVVRTIVTRDDRTEKRILRVETPGRYYYHDTTDAVSAEVTEFSDERFRYRRLAGPPYGLLFNRYQGGDALKRHRWVLVVPIRSFLNVENATLRETRVDGSRYYRLEARQDSHPQLEQRRNVRVKATIRADGLVTSLTASYELRRNRSRTNVTRSVEVYGIGETTVRAPDWVERRWNGSQRVGMVGP